MNKTTEFPPRPVRPIAPRNDGITMKGNNNRTVLLLTGLLLVLTGICSPCLADYTSSYSYSSSRSTITRTTRPAAPQASCPLRRTSKAAATTVAVPRDDGTSVKIGSGPFARNCVLYLRKERGIPLPQRDLSSFASKLSIVNSQTPMPGEVAVIRIGQGHYARIGHLAEVVSVEDNGYGATLRLREANYPASGYYIRTVAARSLREAEKNANIVGYYQPI